MTGQFTIGDLIVLVSVLASIGVTLGTAFYFLGRRFERVEQRLSNVQRALTGLNGMFRGHTTLAGTIVSVLYRRQALTPEELAQVLSAQGEIANVAASALLAIEIGGANPLMVQDAQRLRAYVDKARRGEFFAREEVQDYQSLVSLLERERSGDPAIWALAALGAFLLGLFLSSQR